jgi:Tol biopolymer transport system component
MWPAMGYTQQTAEELFQAGLYQEEAQGALELAIQLYRQLVDQHPGNREVAAKAQLHIGLCYEKLGLTEARQAYRSVIDDFPEQREEVAMAQDRLANLTQELAELRRQPTFRKIEIASNPQNGVLSPDGRQLGFVSEGGVWVVPLEGNVDPDIAGEPVRIAEVPGVWDLLNLAAWSADGNWIAVNAGRAAWGETAIHAVPAGGGEARVVRVPPRGQGPASYRVALSPDGQSVAYSALDPEIPQDWPENNLDTYVYLAPPSGEDPEKLTPAWSTMPAFSADGEHIAYVALREREDWPASAEADPIDPRRFDRDLWVVPSVGGTPIRLASVNGYLKGPVWSPDGRFIAAHYAPAGSNPNDNREIWVFPLSGARSRAGEPIKIALPRATLNMLAGWTPDGELGAFIETESHEAIFTVPASGGRAFQVTREGMYPYYPRWSPDGERVYLRWVEREGDDFHVRMAFVPAEGGEPVEVNARFERQVTPKVPGGGFNVSPDGERIVIVGREQGVDPEVGADVWAFPLDGGPPIRLTSDESYEDNPCWSPDGQSVAFIDWSRKSEDEGFRAIFLVPAQGGEIKQLSVEADSVVQGAIAFSPDGERIAFFSNGQIKTIPVDGGQSEVLVDAPGTGRRSELVWSPDGRKIAYSAAGEIWTVSVVGGERVQLRTGLPEDARYQGFSWSRDGEKIAFHASYGGQRDFWLISNFLP